jgi:hypothetical protein
MRNRKFNILALVLLILVIISGCVSQNNGTHSDNNPPIVEDTDDMGGNDTESPASNVNEDTDEQGRQEQQNQQTEVPIDEDGTYTDPYLVAEYIHRYNKLPSNYITKNEARESGWESDKGNL